MEPPATGPPAGPPSHPSPKIQGQNTAARHSATAITPRERSGLARAREVTAVYDQARSPIIFRDTGQVMPMFDGFSLVEPGLVHITAWRPEGPISNRFEAFLGAVGRKD